MVCKFWKSPCGCCREKRLGDGDVEETKDELGQPLGERWLSCGGQGAIMRSWLRMGENVLESEGEV